MDKSLDFGSEGDKLGKVVGNGWKLRKNEKTIPTLLKNLLKGIICSSAGKILSFCRKNKGSLRNPFLYLGLISVCLFLSSVFLAPFSLAKPNFSEQIIGPQALSCGSQAKDAFIESTKPCLTESPDLIFIQKDSLVAGCPPNMITPETLGSLSGSSDTDPSDSNEDITEYTVRTGDTLSSLSEKFNISVETIAWANDLSKTSKIKPGQSLVILPVSGILYYVNEKDTLAGISKAYKSDVNKIVAFNGLASADDIYPGDILLIPDGVMPAKQPTNTVPSPSSLASVVSGYFIAPLSSPYIITQGLHWYNAIDLSHKGGSCGNPVYAAAGGTVQKTGFDSTAGNYIRILHPNGAVTFYGHLLRIDVKKGEPVSVGQTIGLIGTTGRSTGCHLHFEVRGAKNPFAK